MSVTVGASAAIEGPRVCDACEAEAAVYDFDSPDALDTALLVDHLRSLMRGESVDVPAYDFAAHARIEGARHVEPAPVIMIEGMLVMCDPTLRSLFDLTIYMDSDTDVQLIRRFERDCRDRGASLERAIQMYLGTAKAAHERYVQPSRREADVVVPNAANEATLDIVALGISGALARRRASCDVASQDIRRQLA